MIEPNISLAEIRKKGLKALTEKLGPVGMIRFMQQFETGSGNYTKEREKLLPNINVKELADKIRPKV